LRDILALVDEIGRFIQGCGFEHFASDTKTRFAVIHAIELIGEASKQLPYAVRRRHPEIPWKKMAGMRDHIIHGYFGIDLEIAWETATRDVPALRPLILAAIEKQSQHPLTS
jgi:uncharacterized protein with HEPN domain